MLVKKGNALFGNLQWSIKFCLSWVYKQQWNRKWSLSSTDHWMVFCTESTDSILYKGRLYRPVSILNECEIVLNLVRGTLKYGGSVRYPSLLKSSSISLYVWSFPAVFLSSPCQLCMCVCSTPGIVLFSSW